MGLKALWAPLTLILLLLLGLVAKGGTAGGLLAIFRADAAAMDITYDEIKATNPELVQRLLTAGASEDGIKLWLADLEAEIQERGELTEDNFQNILLAAAITVSLKPEHSQVVNALFSQFGGDISAILKGELPADLVPIAQVVKRNLLYPVPVVEELTVIPSELVSFGRPTQITGRADRWVRWLVRVKLGDVVISENEYTGQEFNDSWAPASSSWPSSTYRLEVQAIGAAEGPNLEKDIGVYNYPILIDRVRTVDLDGRDKNEFLPGEIYQVEMVSRNLEPLDLETLFIIKTTVRQGGVAPVGTIASLGSIKMTVRSGRETTISVGSLASAPGEYEVEVLTWNMWLAEAIRRGERFSTLGARNVISFKVVGQ